MNGEPTGERLLSKRELATQEIIHLIRSNPNYSILDIKRTLTHFFPRRLIKNEGFEYIYKRVLNEYVMPKLEKKERTDYREKEVHYEQEKLRQARIDGVTDLYTRKYFEKLFKEYKSQHPKQTLLMIDLDYFKQCNDTFGHVRGDEALKTFGGYMKDIFDGEGLFCRFGGEEFLIAVPEEYAGTLDSKLGKLRSGYKTFVKENFREKDTPFKGTFSIGVYNADFNQQGESFTRAYRRADDALYKAKQIRNTTQVWDQNIRHVPHGHK